MTLLDRPVLAGRAEDDGAVPAVFDRVHVVTVTHNSASTVGPYLDALAGSSLAIAGVTVVDNASTDDTVQRLRERVGRTPFELEVVENANTGFAGGYLAAAGSRFDAALPVLCLNPDVLLAPGAVAGLLDVLNSFPEAGVVTMPLVENDGSPDTASRRSLPRLGGSMVYSVLGRFTPARLRYNAQEAPSSMALCTVGGRPVSVLEATTGALMLVRPAFRALGDGIFDRDYWMYGEDLQLCADARSSGYTVLMAEIAPSVHLKGVSSGRPRSHRSNRAFHAAMLLYARKNLVRSPVAVGLLAGAIAAHFAVSEVRALPARARRMRRRPAAA